MRLTAASSPQIRSGDNVKVTMGDVIILMIPLEVVAIFYYGWRALALTLVSILSSVVFEYLYRRLFGRSRSIGDLSAIVTGFFIAFCMPATAPIWYPVLGSFFAIVIVKQLYGGIGKNVFNPAVAGIAFLTVTFPGVMSTFPNPFNSIPLFATPKAFETGRTALAALRAGIQPDNKKYEMMFGYTPGNLGTACIVVILIAGLYLLYRRIINWQVPVCFLGVVAIAAAIFPRCPSGRLDSVFYELTSGSLLFAALFMATDPVTSPVTGRARAIYGACMGFFTVILRYNGIYPEGAFFAILLMNPFALALDRLDWKLRVRGGRMLYAKE
jgi:Na+-translocating ferredoxin:NAD+ oxidoreductase subunit D